MTKFDEGRIAAIMDACERSEDLLHKRLAVILNNLHDDHNVGVEIIEEIENLYIEKGAIYCKTGYYRGFEDAGKKASHIC